MEKKDITEEKDIKNIIGGGKAKQGFNKLKDKWEKFAGDTKILYRNGQEKLKNSLKQLRKELKNMESK